MPRLFETVAQKKRRLAFEGKGFTEPPIDRDERLSLAQKFLDQGDADTAFMLFDRVEDFFDPDFLNFVASNFYSNPNSRYFDLIEAEKHLRRAFMNSEDKPIRSDVANNLISIHFQRKEYGADDATLAFSDELICNAVSYLLETGVGVKIFQFGGADRTRFFVAGSYAAGHANKIDHTKAIESYKQYFQGQEEGHFVETYQNLAIRYALGLGTSSDPQTALNVIRTGKILVKQSEEKFNIVIQKTLERFARSKDNPKYTRTVSRVVNMMRDGGHPFGLVTFIEDSDQFDSEATADAIVLCSWLAHAENWPYKKYWPNMVQSVVKKSGLPEQLYINFGSETRLHSLSEFDEEVLKIEGKELCLSKKRIDLHDYFQEHGLGIPPIDQEKRRQLSEKLIDQIPPNYEAALLLFDSEVDSKHSNWLLLVGAIYDRHIDNPFFDAEKAFDYFIRSSKLENFAASYNLALKYSSGMENEIDLEAAFYWWNKAKEQGDIDADYQMARSVTVHDPKYYQAEEVALRKNVHDRIIDAANNHSFLALSHASRICASGRMEGVSNQTVIDIYARAVEGRAEYHEESTKYEMVWRYALRNFLGLGVEENSNKAIELLKSIPDKSNNFYVSQTLKNFSEKLKSIIMEGQSNPAIYSEIKQTVQESYYGSRHISDISTCHALSQSVDILWCVNQLAQGEEWLNRQEWEEALRVAQARNMGLNYQDIVTSTLLEGPRYNPRAENGMPVLGLHEPLPENHAEMERQKVNVGSYVPSDGVVKFNGVTLSSEGKIIWDRDVDPKKPANLVAEDFDVALILAFGDPDQAIHPVLSLEDPNRHGITDKHEVFMHKMWNPKWLGSTDLGRTLYITDQLIAGLCWKPREFDIAPLKDAFEPEASDFALGLTEDIAMTGGRAGAGSSVRVMLVPEYISVQPGVDEDEQLTMKIAEVKMRIDGDYIVVGDSKNMDIHHHKNEDMYQQGRTVNKLTRRYNDIASVMPVFARLQELMALMEATRELRRYMDYLKMDLHPGLKSELQQRYREYEARPPLPLHEQLCVPLPLTLKRI